MASWTELLTHAEPGDHVVQLYGEDNQPLAKNVSRYLAEGMRRLDGLLVIAIPEHAQVIARHLAQDDARARILVNGWPDEALFDAVISEAMREVRARSGSGRVRAFGEMVGLLWSESRSEEAELLEALWNALLAGSDYSLYCAYRIDLFGEDVDKAALSSIVAAHTHLCAGTRTVFSSGRVRG
jgi:hypothetical protein